MKIAKHFLWLLLFIPYSAVAWQWMDLWLTPDQQASQLLHAGQFQAAAARFHDKKWQGVSHYRAHNYQRAYQLFHDDPSSDGQYNAGNAAALMGNYQDAISAYDNAIALNPHHHEAIINREIIKKLMQQQQQHTIANNNNNTQRPSSLNETSQQHDSVSQKQHSKQQTRQSSPNQAATHPNQTPLAQHATQDQTKSFSPSAHNANQKIETSSAATKHEQRQKEDSNQLLRQLPDETTGLLQRKFLRDYLRRHGMEDNLDQGIS